MQALSKSELVGFVEVKVGSRNVQVPVRSIDPQNEPFEGPGPLPLASFAVNGRAFAILVRGEPGSPAVETAVREAAHDAFRHLSRTLLN